MNPILIMEIPDILRSVDYYILHITYNISMNAYCVKPKKILHRGRFGVSPLSPIVL